MKIKLVRGGVIKRVKVGFSWTTFFFGPFPMIARGMWPQFFIMIFTLGWAWFYYIFMINADYREKLAENGWVEHHD